MDQESLDKFAKIFIEHVRDRAIESIDISLKFNNLNNPVTKRWHDAMQKGDIQELARNIIADSVDTALFYTLFSVDEGLFDIIYTDGKSKYNLGEEHSGELGGYFSGLWVEEFSKQRFYNDLKDGEDMLKDLGLNV